MSLYSLQKDSPNAWFYSMKDKLWQYVYDKSVKVWKDADKQRDKIGSKEELENYAAFMKSKFIENIGGIPYDKNLPLDAKIVDRIEDKDLYIEKVIYTSRENVYVTANIYLPKNLSQKCGAVLFLCGHSAIGKFSPVYQNVCRTIASTGLVVMAIDPVGQGERISYVEKGLEQPMVEATVPDHIYSGNQCFLNGVSPIRFFVSDAMRAIDYLCTRSEVDAERIGVTGASGGGTLTSHMMICDPRVKAAAPAAYITDRKAWMNTGKVQDAEQIWLNAGIYGFDYYEIMACFAPKPCILLTDLYDFFPIEGAQRVYEKTKKYWAFYDKSSDFLIETAEAKHGYAPYLAEKAAQFFAYHLLGKKIDATYKEQSIDSKLLQCTKTGQVALDYPESRFLYDENLDIYRECMKRNDTSEFLREKIYFCRADMEPIPKKLESTYENGLEITPMMWFSEPDLPNSAYIFRKFDVKKIQKMYIILSDNGTEDIERYIFKIRRLLDEKSAVMLVNLSGIGSTLPYSCNEFWLEKEDYGILDSVCKNMYFLGDSLCALNLYEMKKLIELVQKYYCEDLEFICSGRMAILCELYNRFEKIEVVYDGEYESLRDIIESKYYENYNIARVILPGIMNYR